MFRAGRIGRRPDQPVLYALERQGICENILFLRSFQSRTGGLAVLCRIGHFGRFRFRSIRLFRPDRPVRFAWRSREHRGIKRRQRYPFLENRRAVRVLFRTYAGIAGDKRIDATLSVGYDAGATVLPYAELGVFTPLEQGKDNNESKYALRLGAYSVIKEQVGVRAGLDAYFDHEHGNYQSYSLFAEGEYVLSPSMTVSLTAGYLLHDTFKYDAGVRTSSFTIGAGFKAAF